jgi:two-component system nitrogen regulation sensor histidine kinase NtrY
MRLGDRLRRHRKDERAILLALLVLLVVLAGVFYLVLRSRDLPAYLVTDQLLLFVLFYVNGALILAILFVLLRNIFKLILERHHGILGSKFKTKLVFANIGLSLIPVLLLFFIAFSILQDSIDRWFNTPQRDMLEQGRNVAQALRERLEHDTLTDAALVLAQTRDLDLGDPSQSPALGRRLRQLLADLDLDFVAVYQGTDFVFEVSNPAAGITEPLRLEGSFLAEAASEGEATASVELEPFGSPGLLVVAARSEASPEAGSEVDSGAAAPGPAAVAVAGSRLEPRLVEQMNRLILDYQAGRQLEVQKDEIKASHLLLFLMVTLLILLVSSWVGMYLARRVTVPIQALAEGTRQIGGGDLSYRVEVEAGDELGVLVDSFNRMTIELGRNKEIIERSHRELVATNQRLAQERALIATVLENVAAGVISIDGDGRILTCNGAALQMLRQTEADVLGKPVSEAWADAERSKLLALLGEGEPPVEPGRDPHDGREVHLSLGGDWRTLAVKVTAMRAHELSGRVVLLEDLTELTKAQKLAAWTEAARRIAHEIKNPLTPIRLSAERLLKKHRESPETLGQAIEDAVEIIVREVASMQRMVDEFSHYARMPGPQPRQVDLERLLEDTLHLYDQIKPGVEVASEVDAGAEQAWLDPEQVKRALINLLDNALEATDAPGRITVAAHRRNGHLEIQVADTGRGIPTQAKEKLFLPHFSTKQRGTGLGLAIVHRIVTDHHGTIRVEDNPPHGTVFTIELPLR